MIQNNYCIVVENVTDDDSTSSKQIFPCVFTDKFSACAELAHIQTQLSEGIMARVYKLVPEVD